MELFRLSNTDRKVKYPPTAVTMRISYSVTHASRTSKAMSRESRMINTNKATTRDNTMMGRVCLANHESDELSDAQRLVNSDSIAIRSDTMRLWSSTRCSWVTWLSRSTRFLTIPKTPESGRASPTASNILGADVRSHCPTFVSRSFFWFDLSKATKLIHPQWDVVDAVKYRARVRTPRGLL